MIFIGCGGSGGTYQIETPPAPPPGVVLSSPALLKNRILLDTLRVIYMRLIPQDRIFGAMTP